MVDVFSIVNARTLWRTVDPKLLRDAGALALASGVVAISFGAIAVASGLPAWAVPAMSVFVFAGGSQFLAVGLISAGNPVAAVLAGLLLNARHLPFGMSVADVVGTRWPARLIGSHLLIDESTAFALAQSDPTRRRQAYWLTGVSLFVCWNIGSLVGAAIGNAVGDPASFGLDAAFPAGLIALILPSLRQRTPRRVAVVGAGVAVVATPLLPAGLPVLLALTGLLAALCRRGSAGAPEPAPTPGPDADRPDVDIPRVEGLDVDGPDVAGLGVDGPGADGADGLGNNGPVGTGPENKEPGNKAGADGAVRPDSIAGPAERVVIGEASC
jgi:4-azaleucine resistance transporter AzlC